MSEYKSDCRSDYTINEMNTDILHEFINYDDLYLRSLEQMRLYINTLTKEPNKEYWLYVELNEAVQHYKRLANVSLPIQQEEPYLKW